MLNFSQQIVHPEIRNQTKQDSHKTHFQYTQETLGDSKVRCKWRRKQNLDFSYLMMYAQSRGRYYCQMEDDIIAKPGNQWLINPRHCTKGTMGNLPDGIPWINVLANVNVLKIFVILPSGIPHFPQDTSRPWKRLPRIRKPTTGFFLNFLDSASSANYSRRRTSPRSANSSSCSTKPNPWTIC